MALTLWCVLDQQGASRSR